MSILSRGLFAAVLLVGFAPLTWAQEDNDFFKKPETPAEFWRAVTFEMNVGKFDLAAQFLQGFLASGPTQKDYLAITEEEGLAAFLRLRNVPQWSDDPDPKKKAANEEAARKAVEQVILQATTAIRKHYSDPERITRFGRQLNASPEERTFAIREIYRSGPAAIPVLLDLASNSPEADRAAIMNILPKLTAETVPPLLAALDVPNTTLRVEIVDALQRREDLLVLARRADTDPQPTLAYFAADPKQPNVLRQLSRDFLARLRSMNPDKLPPGKVDLTAAAAAFDTHQARFTDPTAISVWRLDGGKLVNIPMSVTQAEEFYGTRYARWALELDPTYQPAQVVLLSLALTKTYERDGVDKPLSVIAPQVHDAIATAPTSLLAATLERALAAKRSDVALGVTRTVSERAEASAVKMVGQDHRSLLLKALTYGDRRVHFAAAEALARLPGPVAREHSARVVEVLRRAMAVEPDAAAAGRPKVLFADPIADRAQDLARLATDAGFRAETATTGRALMKRLNEAADIDAVVVDEKIWFSQLPNVLANLRADSHAGLLPVRVIATGENRTPAQRVANELRLQRLTERYPNIKVVSEPFTTDAMKEALARADDAVPMRPLSEAERREYALRAMILLRSMAIGERAGFDVKPAEAELRQALRNDELAPLAVDAVGRLPSKEAQRDLADTVLNPRPEPLRIRAAVELVAHIQRFGPLLTPLQVERLEELYTGDTPLPLKSAVAAPLGLLRPDPRQTGERLRAYKPTLPGPAPAPEPKEADKE